MIDGRFELVDHHGTEVTNATYRGRYLLVFFGFTHCRVICPEALSRIGRALAAVEDLSEKIVPLYVSVDPERDTPAVMKAFLEDNHPRFTGLTGTREQVEAAKRTFRVFAQEKPDPEDPDDYAVPHTAFTYLLDPEGAYVTHFPDHVSAESMAERLRELIV